MALPKQVQAQLAEVEELEKTLATRGEKPKNADEAKTEDQTDTAVESPDTDAKVAPKPEKAKPADTSPTDVAVDFEQKYRTIQGKYDAEVPNLKKQVRDLEARVDQLLKQQSTPAKPEEPTKPKEKVSYVTDADRAEFGEELIDVQRRVAREVAEEYQDKIDAQAEVIKTLEGKLADTGNQIGQVSFAQRLSRLVPDFEQVDRDERWVSWLNEYDPMLRAPRRTQAAAAFEAGDAEAVADYVKLWKSSIAEAPTPVEDKRQEELEKQVSPNRSATSAGAGTAGTTPKTYSERELQASWDKVRVLNTRGKVDEAAKLEAEITAAYLEGRVRT